MAACHHFWPSESDLNRRQLSGLPKCYRNGRNVGGSLFQKAMHLHDVQRSRVSKPTDCHTRDGLL